MYLFFYCCLGLQCVHFTVMLRSSSCKFHNVMLNYGVAGENDPLYKLIASRELLSSEEVLKPWPVVHFLPIKCNLEELTHLCSLSLTFCCCFCCCFIYVFPPPPEPTHCVSAENGADSYVSIAQWLWSSVMIGNYLKLTYCTLFIHMKKTTLMWSRQHF